MPFQIALAGWTWRAPRKGKPSTARPFIWLINRHPRTGSVVIRKSPRHLASPTGAETSTRLPQLVTNVAPKENSGILGRDAVWGRLAACPSRESFEQELIRCVRDASSIVPRYIGSHCTLVAMPPPGSHEAAITYYPDLTKTELHSEGVPKTAYSPWVLADQVMFPPTQTTMGSETTLKLGAWSVSQTFIGAGESRIGGRTAHDRRGP
jgi:hypothetical protein